MLTSDLFHLWFSEIWMQVGVLLSSVSHLQPVHAHFWHLTNVMHWRTLRCELGNIFCARHTKMTKPNHHEKESKPIYIHKILLLRQAVRITLHLPILPMQSYAKMCTMALM